MRPLEEEPAQITSVDALRATLLGTYRSCTDGTGLELRADPALANRVLWYRLDSRFVRQTEINDSGWFDIGDCTTYSCTTQGFTGGHADDDGIRSLTVWSDPTAISIDSSSTGARDEWVRVAK